MRIEEITSVEEFYSALVQYSIYDGISFDEIRTMSTQRQLPGNLFFFMGSSLNIVQLSASFPERRAFVETNMPCFRKQSKLKQKRTMQ